MADEPAKNGICSGKIPMIPVNFTDPAVRGSLSDEIEAIITALEREGFSPSPPLYSAPDIGFGSGIYAEKGGTMLHLRILLTEAESEPVDKDEPVGKDILGRMQSTLEKMGYDTLGSEDAGGKLTNPENYGFGRAMLFKGRAEGNRGHYLSLREYVMWQAGQQER